MAVTTTSRHLSLESLEGRYPGSRVYVLELTGGLSTEAFFTSGAQNLPMDPPLGSGHKWDAFSDSLFGGILASGERKVVIYWADAGEFASADPESFAVAREVLQDVNAQLEDPDVTQGRVVTLDVVLYCREEPSGPVVGSP